MNKHLKTVLIVVTIIYTLFTLVVIKTYQEYVYNTQRLLEEIEMVCEDNDLPWGDTICEGDNWSDYIDSCRKIRITK